MSHSLSKLYVHIVFHIKNNNVQILPETEQELYTYIGGIIKTTSSIPIKINGTGNHIHILSIMSKNISLARFVEEIKRNSSRWIKSKGNHYKSFAWQGGYAGYSVGQTNVKVVEKYIANQKQHHNIVSFQEEYKKLLEDYGINYDENFLWE